MKRHVDREHQWMGSGMTDEQIKGVQSLVKALRYYAAKGGPDAEAARIVLDYEATEGENHTSVLGARVTPPQEVV
jgi:hypothetical protein